MIDQRAIIDSSAKIAKDVSIGPWTIIGPGVEIGEGTWIGSNVVIDKYTKIGAHNKIYHFAALGGDPQHSAYTNEKTYLEIGDHNIFREFCTINRGTKEGRNITQIGNKNFFMAYTHVGHDCIVGNHNTFANNASIAGHVHVGEHVGLSAFVGVHQRVAIGSYSFLGRAAIIVQDIPPYVLVTGNPATPRGLNVIGLKRHGYSDETIRYLKRAYSIMYRQGLKLKDAIAEIQNMAEECAELQIFIEALQNSNRGLAR